MIADTAAFADLEDDQTDALTLERRRGTRVRLVRPILLTEATRGRTLAGTTRDISHSGLRLRVPVLPLRAGDQVHVDVSSIAGLGLLPGRRRTMSARVVWARREAKMVRPMMTLGIEFDNDFDAQVNVA